MMFYIYVISILVFIALFLWGELRCSGKLTVKTALQVLIISLIPVVNTVGIFWFIFDSAGDYVIYKKGVKK